MGRSEWVRDMDGLQREVDIPLTAEKRMDDKADLMMKLLEKLPQVVTKPIVVQHTQTMDERFTLTVHEAENVIETLPTDSTTAKTD